jgi:hypothetical protein
MDGRSSARSTQLLNGNPSALKDDLSPDAGPLFAVLPGGVPGLLFTLIAPIDDFDFG